MRKCQKFPLKLVVKSALLAAMLKNQLYFVSAVVQISRIRRAVHHCACNPLFQNTTAHITTVAMDYIISLGCQSHPAFFAFSLFFSRLSSAISAQYKSFRVELKMGTRKSHIEAKIEHLFRFLTQFFCYLIQVQHRIRKKIKLTVDVTKLNEI